MRDPNYSSVNPENGNVNYHGPTEIMPSNRNHMTDRTDAYRPDDDKGHLQASSLGGVNSNINVVPQNHDVNHGGYYSMEEGERAALNHGAIITSDKTAYVDGQPGDRPHDFHVNDSVTYTDGHTEHVNLSFINESYADQDAWNTQSAAVPGNFDAPNPNDGLRSSMRSSEYSSLMEETDASLPNISDMYAPSDYSGPPPSSSWDAEFSVETDAVAVSEGGALDDFGADDANVDAGDDGASPDED